MKRVNIPLKDEIHQKAKIISVLKNITLNEYLQKAIEEAIAKDENILSKIDKLKEKKNEKWIQTSPGKKRNLS